MISLLDRWNARIAAHRWTGRLLGLTDRAAATIGRVVAAKGNYVAACVIVLGIQAALIFSHVPWRDEWQALQIAVQSPDLAALLQALRFEGHPPLWYLLLRAVAGVVGNRWALPAAAALCAGPAQVAILARAPFPRVMRLAIACSVFLLFEFFTVSRSLTLGAALTIGTLTCWRSPLRWLFITLLPQCDVQFGLISIALIACAWRERRPPVAALVGWLISSGLAALSVVPDPAFAPDGPPAGLFETVSQFINGLGLVLLPLQWEFGPAWNASLPLPLLPVGWLAAILFLRAQTSDDWLAGRVVFGFIAALLAISLLAYPLANRHIMLIALILIAIVWLRALGGIAPSRGFTAWTGAAAVIGLGVAAYSAFVPFDTGERFASEVQRRGLAGRHWMTVSAAHAQPISATTGMRFERLTRPCTLDYVRWNVPASFTTRPALYRYLRDLGAQRGSFYLLSAMRLPRIPADVARLRFVTRGGYNSQSYFAYEIAPGRPPFRASLPPCVPGLKPFAPANLAKN